MKADQVTSLLGMGWERTGLEGWSTRSRPEGLGTECRVKADPVSGWALVADGGVMLRDSQRERRAGPLWRERSCLHPEAPTWPALALWRGGPASSYPWSPSF